MQRLRTFTLPAVALFVLASASALVAQPIDPETILRQFPLQVPFQTQRAKATFLGPDHWTDLAPATYSVRVPGTALCLTRTTGATLVERPHLRLRTCQISTTADGASDASQLIQIAPGAVDVPPAQGFSNVRWRFTLQITAQEECAGAARNVVFGPARVDWNGCDLMPYAGGDVAHRGAPDQLFFMRKRSASGEVPRFQIRSIDRKCWTVQGGDIRDGTALVMEDCDGRAGQVFEFRYFGPLIAAPDRAAADKFGWKDAPSISRFPNSADRFRDLPAIAIDDPGYSNTETADDWGTACAALCRTDDNCRAFTWIPRSASTAPQCSLKQNIPQLVDRPGTNSGIMRP